MLRTISLFYLWFQQVMSPDSHNYYHLSNRLLVQSLDISTLHQFSHHNGLRHGFYVAAVLLMQVRPCTPTSSRQLSRLVYYLDQFPESRPDLENRPGHWNPTYCTCSPKWAILKSALLTGTPKRSRKCGCTSYVWREAGWLRKQGSKGLFYDPIFSIAILSAIYLRNDRPKANVDHSQDPTRLHKCKRKTIYTTGPVLLRETHL